MVPIPSPTRSFRFLRRRLLRRRIAEIETRLKVELMLIGVLVSGFVFWQARVSLDSLQRAAGPQSPALAVLAVGLLLATIGGSLVAARHRRRLHAPPGPPWLSLPIESRELAEHLAWESRLHAMWMLPFHAGILIAVTGLLPLWEVVLLAAASAVLLLAAARAGTSLALEWAIRQSEPRPGFDPISRLLGRVAETPARAGRGLGHWPRLTPWLALCWKDALLSLRATGARPRAILPLVLGALSVACWMIPIAPPVAHALALGLSLLAATTLGEWLIALSGEDPFAILRGLPIGARVAWASRASWVFAATLALVVAHALAARPLAPHALLVFLTWTAGAVLAIGLLGAHYGLTLFPRAQIAQRLYALALGISLAASIMIPLFGWLVLLAALVHSTRRLPYWSRLEDVS